MKWLKRVLVPSDLRDYARVGPLLIFRKLWILLLTTVLSIPVTLFGFPTWLFSRPAPAPKLPLFAYDAPALAAYSGQARIADENGVVRYCGDIAAGQCTGMAEVFSADGVLAYRGPVVEGRFEGEDGVLYNGDGSVLYQGGFLNSLYEGEGTLHDAHTGVTSTGGFTAGAFSGTGAQYRPDGTPLREGTFLNGRLSGEGKEYGDTGQLLREGTFSAGRLEGAGLEYEAGALLYEGAFHNGVRQGEGTLYDPKTGRILFAGTFLNGEPCGPGQLFNSRGQLCYEGSVYSGEPDLISFLGASLADVEKSFPVHGLVYACGDKTAFAWPDLGIAFVTDSPVLYASKTLGVDAAAPDPRAVPPAPEEEPPAESAASTEAPSPSKAPPAEAGETGGAGSSTAALPAKAAAPGGAANEGGEPSLIQDYTLADANKKQEIIITGVIRAGGRIPGFPPGDALFDAPDGRPAGWREFIAATLLGKESRFCKTEQAGEFVFLLESAGKSDPLHWQAAGEDGVAYTLCQMQDKGGSILYTAAEKAADPEPE